MSETLDEQSRTDLVKYRIERANETLLEARLLAKEGYYNAAFNRLYYACFYAALALLVKNGISTSTHTGVKTMLGLHFVSKGLLEKEHGKTFSRLFEIRHSGDYDDFVYCDKEMTDGHILMAHQHGLGEVAQDGTVLWHYDAPQGTEIHTAQPIGRSHVVFVQNGQPAKVVVIKIPECQVVSEFEVPASKGVHGQFRNARLTTRGTLLVAHMGLGYVAEYSRQGNELDRWEVRQPWSVCEVGKERLLIVAKGLVREMDRSGEVVWEQHTADLGLTAPQKAVRLKNGNTIINNWWNEWGKTSLDAQQLQSGQASRETRIQDVC